MELLQAGRRNLRRTPGSIPDTPDATDDVKMAVVAQYLHSVLVGQCCDPDIVRRNGEPSRFNSRRMSA